MRKIEGWNEIEKNEVVEFVNLGAGPQVCKILKVLDVQDKEYLKIAFDVSGGEFKGCFKEQLDRDDRDDKKWPNSGIMYKSYKASAARFFAAFVTSVEKSNTGYKFEWKEQSLVGKTFVANFREEEWLTDDNEVKVSLKCYEPRSTIALQEGRIKTMEIKKLEGRPMPKEKTPIDINKPVNDLPF